MSNRRIPSKNQQDKGKLDRFLASSRIPWEKSKEQVWMTLSNRLKEESASEIIPKRTLPVRPRLALAASIALLLGILSFMRLHTRSLSTLAGEHASLELPDGSLVDLNAVTTVSFHPYWWARSREVKLEGEAFFQVEKGSNFKVSSLRGITQVLGTSFNVFAREMDYRVICHSGRVEVSSRISDEIVTLGPEMQVSMDSEGKLNTISFKNLEAEPGWKNNMLVFTSVPLSLVFEEIERQYDLVILTPPNMTQCYTGRFSLDASVENVLTLLCLPFDLMHEQSTGNTYIISESRER